METVLDEPLILLREKKISSGKEMRPQIGKTSSDDDREPLRERPAKRVGGVAFLGARSARVGLGRIASRGAGRRRAHRAARDRGRLPRIADDTGVGGSIGVEQVAPGGPPGDGVPDMDL